MRFLKLDQYYLEETNEQLREIAEYLLLNVYKDHLIEAQRPAFVLLGSGDLSTLKPGYYFRIILLKPQGFHLYGIEVTDSLDVLVHENISRYALPNHADEEFRVQLMALNKKEKVVFRTAVKQGGGVDLHTDLLRQYVESGAVGKSFESQYQMPFPKSVVSSATSVLATERTSLLSTHSSTAANKPPVDYFSFRARKLDENKKGENEKDERESVTQKKSEVTLSAAEPLQRPEQGSAQQLAAKRFFDTYQPGCRSYWAVSQLSGKASLSAIVKHAVYGSKIGFFSSYSGKNTKNTLLRLGVTEMQLKENALDEIAACLNRR